MYRIVLSAGPGAGNGTARRPNAVTPPTRLLRETVSEMLSGQLLNMCAGADPQYVWVSSPRRTDRLKCTCIVYYIVPLPRKYTRFDLFGFAPGIGIRSVSEKSSRSLSRLSLCVDFHPISRTVVI